MIIRRYGNRMHSVTLDFDSAALTEVGFRRDGERAWDLSEFLDEYHMVREESIIAEATAAVQDEAERAMLDELEGKFRQIYEELEEGQFLGVESQPGVDYPRTRYDRSSKGGQAFTYTLDRPLRLGVWAKRTP